MATNRLRNPLALLNVDDRERLRQAKVRRQTFLGFLGEDRRLVIHELTGRNVTLGRSTECDVCLSWDEAVSATTLEFTRVGTRWRVEDVAGRNRVALQRPQAAASADPPLYLFLNPGERHLLSDGDLLQVGDVALTFCSAGLAGKTTKLVDPPPPPIHTTESERRLLRVLCRPILEAGGDPSAHTPSDKEIASELHIALTTVKNRVSKLCVRFGVDDLPPGRKREALARLAIASGTVGPLNARVVQ